jgi:hypothetical protein
MVDFSEITNKETPPQAISSIFHPDKPSKCRGYNHGVP